MNTVAMIAAPLAAALVGGLGWTLTEYLMHRFNGHGGKGKTRFSREHLRHHAEKDYFTPDRIKVVMALPAFAGLAAVSIWLTGPLMGVAFTVGFAATYVYYEWLHYSLHVTPPRGRYSRWARKHHFAHHFNCPKQNHGVTSPLWDWVFRTLERPEQVRVPARHAMDWLRDPATREVHAAFAADYVVRGREPAAS